MHIPDGFLTPQVWIPTAIVGALIVYRSVKKTEQQLEPKKIPTIALVGATIFTLQMINFPISSATSGHFLGTALAANLFGPWVSILLMSAVLIIQALIFQDGGITALGANILCTGFIGSFVGYGTFRYLTSRFLKSRPTVAMFVSAWTSITVASMGVAMLIALSGTLPLKTALLAMTGWHSLIGIGEGIISVLAWHYLAKQTTILPFGVTAHEKN